MCWPDLPEVLRSRFTSLSGTTPNSTSNRVTPTPSTVETGARDAFFMRRMLLGNIGKVGTFPEKVREAGLGTSITPKPIGSVVKDPTRQS